MLAFRDGRWSAEEGCSKCKRFIIGEVDVFDAEVRRRLVEMALSTKTVEDFKRLYSYIWVLAFGPPEEVFAKLLEEDRKQRRRRRKP